MAVFPTVVHSEVKRGPLLHTAEAGYLSLQQRGILGGWGGECFTVWMPICKLTEKSLCPVVNGIWVREGTIIVNIQYLQLTINVESTPQACRQMFPFFFFLISLARLVPEHCDRMLLL